MRAFLASLYRISTRAGFLAAALLLGLVFWYLPNFLNLDEFRPQLTTLLETTFHCKVIVGNVTGQLVPYPGLVVGHVVFLEEAKTPIVLASVGSVHLWISKKALFKGHVKVYAIQFSRPRFIVRHERGNSGEGHLSLRLQGGA